MKASTANPRMQPRDGLWLAAAVVVHAALLMIPLHWPEQESRTAPELSISLALTQPHVVPLREQPAVAPPASPAPQPGSPAPPPPDRQVTQTTADNNTDRITAARLTDSLSLIKLPESRPDAHRELGKFIPRAVPWARRPSHGSGDNRFDGMFAPATTRIVDRWLAADGSHNVVIDTPTGDTLCGRAAAWDPANPLLEPVMMFRPCGGGGKRTFEMPARYRIPGARRESFGAFRR